ncbi:MAG: 50S ribosomal protein L18 [Deltaproteobacteria bacterium]|nr:50S ribosomal protein L18 [Deltaproteobacteria bacterium]MBW2051738.1 50S ribosomal protein L18 [Deltaproteobacteria bacterium]MBW2140277.1 50S ribosomal protein L18 [Deltaproteobacteria bacterium]MBW2322120.1 50S ribosomal protein L18 [Deltaproteobacteria bacterium]
MAKVNPRAFAREKRKKRVRKKVKGTAVRPRLCVFRSARHIYAQIIDDESGRTLTSFSTLTPALRDRIKGMKKREAAKLIGEAIGSKAKEKGIVKVVFDRNGFLYHGRVQALSNGAREAGLEF